jgi:DNA-binding NarL/FixJ family response regulator
VTAAEAAARPRVFLVDDHAMVRTGVRAELGQDVDVVGEAADVAAAVEGIRATAPDVVLLDVHLPGGGGRAVLEQVRGELPAVRWLALSVSDAAEDVIAVIRAGARGYVTKSISGTDLLDAVRRVADGDVVFSPRLAGFVLDAFAAGGAAPPAPAEDPAVDPGLDLLSAREREVMQLLARGYTYREIGSRLFISVKTVESHASNVLRKLQLSNRNELTRWAATNRLL